MRSDIADDAEAAWRRLCEAGGIEITGRDADFVDELSGRLQPSAPTLDAALRASSTDKLVREFFSLAQPFTEMFRAILSFFKAAGAKEGREHWSIKVDEEHVDLKHFERFLKRWDELECELEVPAIDRHGNWALHRSTTDLAAARLPRLVFSEMDNVRNGRPVASFELPEVAHDVNDWLSAFVRGRYDPFPKSLQPAAMPKGLADAADIALAAQKCGLVVEVKHYKREARSRFRDVMIDYARAHPEAAVVLVNHGPASESLGKVSNEIYRRCTFIGNLTTNSPTERDELRQIVRKYVGEPMLRPQPGKGARGPAVVAIDVSASMSGALDSPELRDRLALAIEAGATTAVLIDTETRYTGPIDAAAEAIRLLPRGGSTSLANPLRALLDENDRILLVTDGDGRSSLSAFHIATKDVVRMGSMDVLCLELSAS